MPNAIACAAPRRKSEECEFEGGGVKSAMGDMEQRDMELGEMEQGKIGQRKGVRLPCLELQDVRKQFGEKEVLRGISLSMDTHDVVCVIGPSGCGKSTLLRCVNLLEKLDSGRIVFNGEDISDIGIDDNLVRRRMGIVFQSFNLFPHLSVLDNLTLGPRRAQKVPKREAEAKAEELLRRFNLEDKTDEYPDRLSGGQQQRVAIVRAMISQPDLLLLDEVTSALDPELVGEVLGVLRELAADGTTMLIATHEMAFARDVATQVCFIHEGKILEAAAPSQIFSDPQNPETQRFLSRLQEGGRL